MDIRCAYKQQATRLVHNITKQLLAGLFLKKEAAIKKYDNSKNLW